MTGKKKKKKQIVIVGAGRIGRALTRVLKSKRGFRVHLYDSNPKKRKNHKKLEKLAPRADFIFLCVPTEGVRSMTQALKPALHKKTIVISLSKSIEQETASRVDEILKAELPKGQVFGLLGGPLMAEELVVKQAGLGVFASRSTAAATKVKNLFKDTNVLIETTTDVVGVAASSVLKNIYACGLGMLHGLGWSGNLHGWYVARALFEMGMVVKAMGGKDATVFGSAGVGDFIATGFSKHSSNRMAGFQLSQKKPCKQSEGVLAISSVMKILGKKSKQYPLLTAINSVVSKKKSAKDAFGAVLKQTLA